MIPTSDVVISGPTLALFTTILTGILGALGFLFKLAWNERDRADAQAQRQYDERYADMRAERDRLLTVAAADDVTDKQTLGALTSAIAALGERIAGVERAVTPPPRRGGGG